MIKNLKTLFTRVFSPESFKIQTFTYYIPSPPARESGYREKQFDKVFYSFINQGFKILSINTQANTGPNHSGMWIICTVRALNKKASKLNLTHYSNDQDLPQDLNITDSNLGPESIEGFYPVDDEKMP